MLDFKINEFEGPLDLLLHLIKVNEMDIMDIKIEEITKQYIDYIDSQEKLNIEVASEYLVMASELIEIKSKLLLPSNTLDEDEEEEVDPREELVEKLLEYEAYKKLSDVLVKKNEDRSSFYTKLPENFSNYASEEAISNNGDIDELVEAFKVFLDRKSKSKPLKTKVTIKEVSVSGRCIEIRKALKKNKKVSFFSLFTYDTKEYIVATFLAVLEMAKEGELTIKQKDAFGDIIVESVK
ncbi:MAG: segregation/condensation protein A [Bacilli bacterium]|nr:segregation/condensation protein A [Bacilli bacterium]